MLTWFLISAASRSSLANEGRSVEKSFALGCPEPALTAFRAVPVIESPVAVMLMMLPASTWSMNTLYGMVTDGDWLADWMTLVTMMLTRSSVPMTSQNRRHRIGL